MQRFEPPGVQGGSRHFGDAASQRTLYVKQRRAYNVECAVP